MKVFKSLLGLVLILTLCTPALMAQQTETKEQLMRPEVNVEQKAQRQTDNLAKKVELTEKQVEKVKNIYIKYGNKEADAKKIEDTKERGQKISKIRMDQEQALKDVMTAEQLAKYQQAKDKKAESMSAKKEQRDVEKRAKEKGTTKQKGEMKGEPFSTEQKAQKKTDRLVEELGLTREQVPQVQKINIDYYTQLDELMKNTEDRTALKDSKNALKETYMASLKNVLTAEQYKKMEEKK